MNEVSRCRRFIYDALTADPDLAALVGTRIYADVAPEPSWPAVVFGTISPGVDTTANGGTRVLTNPLFLVRGISEGHGQTTLEQIADRIDAALQAAFGRVGEDAYVAGIVRESTHDMPEMAEGKLLRHLGGRYRVHVHAA